MVLFGPRHFNFYFKNIRIFIQNTWSYSLKVAVSGFQNYKKKSISIFAKSLENKPEHELFRGIFQ